MLDNVTMSDLSLSEQQLTLLNTAFLWRKQRKALKILIVEDQSMSYKLVLALLGNTYECHVAVNGEEALQKFAEQAPDIILLDIHLPDANGHNLASLFKKHDPNVFITMVTANNNINDIQLAKANNVNGYIVKPFMKEKIMAQIVSYFKLKRKKTT